MIFLGVRRKSRKGLWLALIAASLFILNLPASFGRRAGAELMPVSLFLRDVVFAGTQKIFASLDLLPLRGTLAQTPSNNDWALLKNENMRLQQELASFQEINIQIPSGELDRFQLCGARIILRQDLSPFAKTCVINAGREQGIREGFGVGYGQGILGVVSRAGRNHSTVTLLTDAAFRSGAITLENRVQGVMRGTGGAELRLMFIPLEAPLLDDEWVLSSGFDGIFPQGLLMGQISRVGAKTYGEEREVGVKPFLKIQDIETVAVFIPKEDPNRFHR